MNIARTGQVNPITLAEAKLFCKANDYDTDDLLIAAQITAAVHQAEMFCNRSFAAQTIQYQQTFLAADLETVTEILLPYPNHTAITEVKVNGVVTTAYTVTGLNHLVVTIRETGAGADGRNMEVIVTYTAGSCNEAEKDAIKNIIREKYLNRSDSVLSENAYCYLMPFRCYY